MGYAPNFASRYTAMEIATADRFELLLLLYKGAIKEAKLAIQAFQAGDIEARVNHLNKACAIIGELRAALDFEHGGEIAVSLERLYHYMTRRLSEANLRRQAGPVEEVAKLLEVLLSAWEEAHTKHADSEGASVSSSSASTLRDRLTLHSTPAASHISVSL